MSERLETVTVVADGAEFEFWHGISIEYGAEQAVRTCTLDVGDPGQGAWPLMPGVECQVYASGDLVITGYVRDFDPSHDVENWSGTVSIVSRTVDAVETSAIHETGNVEDKDLLEIAQIFDNLGIGWSSKESFPPEKWHQLIPGESNWATVERVARSRGVLIYDNPEGTLELASKSAGYHGGALMIGEGGNIVSARGKLTEKDRHTPVKVRGQVWRGTGEDSLRPEAEAQDKALKRERPLIVIHEGEAVSDRLKKRAEWQVRRAAGRSVSADVTVAGWRDQGGTLWMPNWTVYLSDPRIYIEQDMAISTVRLTQDTQADGEGTRAHLTLVDPRALGGEDPKGESAEAWSTQPAAGSLKVG